MLEPALGDGESGQELEPNIVRRDERRRPDSCVNSTELLSKQPGDLVGDP